MILERPGGLLVDVQFNSVYYQPEDGQPFHFIAAGDLQWGGSDEVMKSIMDFVLSMNLRAKYDEMRPPRTWD